MKLKPKKWAEFQHYKDRCPPWIKLQKSLLDDYEFHSLQVASRALAPMLWLLASESTDGVFDASIDRLAFRLRADKKELSAAVKELIEKGFFIVASDVLADCLQDAVPETETETETDRPANADRFCFKTSLLDAGGNPDLVADWLKVRAKLKATNTKTAFNLFMGQVSKAGYTINQALEVCCSRSWKGFDSEWVKGIKTATDKQTVPAMTPEEYAIKRKAEMAAARERYQRDQEAASVPVGVAK